MGKSGSADSGANATGTQPMNSNSGSRATSSSRAENVRAAQQALKDKGYDPGAVDGVMGSRTREAIKNFQTASNLKATGTLNSETREKLGIQSTASANSGSMGSNSNMNDHSGQTSSKTR
jgi:peptidoglycan hydrolase-like protein with peptidoglycan-binding domain